MKVEVLLSCMHQKDKSIIQRSNIQSDVVVINQCDHDAFEEFEFVNKRDEICKVKFISTIQRGLSKSRNLAIKYASGDVCLICDDDECLDDNYPELISDIYKDTKIDFAAFKLEYNKKYWKKQRCINKITALKIASWQISFRRDAIVSHRIRFDEKLGSGVSKAGGEEIQFLYDCISKKLRGHYFPVFIGKHLQSGESQWWKGYNIDYFRDRGIFTRRLMGRFNASLYGLYFLIAKHREYKRDIGFREATRTLFSNILKND